MQYSERHRIVTKPRSIAFWYLFTQLLPDWLIVDVGNDAEESALGFIIRFVSHENESSARHDIDIDLVVE